MTALAVQAPNAGQMASPLKGTGPFTSFAPHLRGVRQTPKVGAADVMKLDGKTATTLNGGNLKFSTKGGWTASTSMAGPATIILAGLGG